MEKKKNRDLSKYYESQAEGGAVFYKNGKVVADTRPKKKGGSGGKKK